MVHTATVMSKLTLIGSSTCPYVQRVEIALREKRADFDVINVDLASKPDWLLAISPLGKVPVLRVERDGEPPAVIFESAAMKSGRLQVQDLGSQLICALCEPDGGFAGKKILDLCAGAGGRSIRSGRGAASRGKSATVSAPASAASSATMGMGKCAKNPPARADGTQSASTT